MSRTCLSIILAAGEGSRMKSSVTKVLHPIGGRPLVAHVAATAAAAGAQASALVVGRDAEAVAAAVAGAGHAASVHLQSERLGTAHAVLAARKAIGAGYDDLLILYGDTPLIRPETLLAARAVLAEGAAICVIGFRPADPTGYGRLIEEGGTLKAIREEKDASAEEKAIGFCNGGVMAIDGRRALDLIGRIGNANAKGEYYLTDIVEIARADGLSVRAIEAAEKEVLGVDDRVKLARAEAVWQADRRMEAMRAGATLIAPDTVTFAYDTVLGRDVLVEPNVFFGAGVTVGEGAVIHAFSHLEGAEVGPGASIGPFARLRPGTRLADGAKVGNFCEVKNAVVGEGAKINHLSYIGDASVGARTNVGAGTITCNYDGFLKHRTEIGADAFIGSDTALVAPIRVGDGAYVGSGSTLTEDVPADALAIARARQVNKPERARSIQERGKAAKAQRRAAGE
ncbi:bifunctional UDP-N-acetylglucosamine diphosphorylase/glucosamine-1-phosphate N-acetyltransferase GlmU [Aurantimonas sp. MSK8Z-1]|uniref:bifunctional UDP-N-acetylglucosamine diphosphorylase/glucosamine-1-phosphate N-acetyltransferase GlmU n=1 Tax=Mangrovibrevibacter kandeliae TaxID=2968473 RepID=UPI002118ACF0|nr:bifunctional UDP-N-acetylglucosamine diphosphorylase/glucosamine-1-phosphate N-acetyltransferase GlmU [Aurantimonas sp. MSK8Z-1]MCW4114065.1 bifunctional UDP-N-acetylglucosamine diphosphorylase/glucosamine-1-phosphate N-acetyltransferase GlmU [Aurantimonas sp. MSK8Z-1]